MIIKENTNRGHSPLQMFNTCCDLVQSQATAQQVCTYIPRISASKTNRNTHITHSPSLIQQIKIKTI